MDSAVWLSQFEDDSSPLQRSWALSAMRESKDAADASRDEAEKVAAAESRREALEFANIQAGNPLGELSRARAALSDADDLRRDALDQLRKADRAVARAQSNIEFWSARLEPVTQVAQRSRVPSDPVEAAQWHAHEVFRARTSALRTEAREVSRSRPKGSGGVVRNEPVTCPHCLAVGATPTESFLLHHSDVNGEPVAAEPVAVSDGAERVASAGYVELTR